jgi:hypothetical protein
MAGGVTVISSWGPQDAYLTVNPEITLFKELYRRHTPFGRQLYEIGFNGNADFGKNTFAEFQRTGDLIGEVYLRVTTPVLTGSATQAWVKELMHFISKNQTLTIGGQKIDKLYDFMYSAMVALTQKSGHKDGYAEMIGDIDEMTLEQASIASRVLYLPLRFWFNMRPGSYLPIVAINKHKIHLEVEFQEFSKLYKTSTSSTVTAASLPDATLLVQYMFLDTPERRQFAKMAHEYLIETTQFTGVQNSNSSNTPSFNLDGFHHPVKEIISVLRLQSEETLKNWHNFARADGSHIIEKMKFTVNGQEYEREQEASYYSNVVPFARHTNIPTGHKKIYIQDIALAPENFASTGTINLSRVSQAIMQYTLSSNESTNIYCFGQNYNVLRVISGMAGPAYQN